MKHELTREYLGESVQPINEKKGEVDYIGDLNKAMKKREKLIKSLEKQLDDFDNSVEKEMKKAMIGKTVTFVTDDEDYEEGSVEKIKNVGMDLVNGKWDGWYEIEITTDKTRILQSAESGEDGSFIQSK